MKLRKTLYHGVASCRVAAVRIIGLVVVVVVVAVTGCGQLELEDDPEVEISSTSSAVASVCAQTRTTVGPVLTTGEVAATRTTNGLYVAWGGSSSQTASIVKVNAQFGVVTRHNIGAYGPRIAGVLDLGGHVLGGYGLNSFGVVDMWKFTADLSSGFYFGDYAGNPADMPFLANPAGTQRAYLWSFQKTMIASHQDSTGYASHGSFFDMPNTITALAGDNGLLLTGVDAVTDSAVVWLEDLGGGASRCLAGNIGYDVPTKPILRATRVVSTDCRYARIAAGPTNGIQAAVTVTAAGTVRAHLRRGGADTVRVLSTAGRAPKIRFDGTRFWIVWRDNGVSNLRIASLDPAGTLVNYPTPGPAVAGDEAFDLVRATTTTTVLVALTPNALDFVTLCR
jgi:hypothetical protein